MREEIAEPMGEQTELVPETDTNEREFLAEVLMIRRSDPTRAESLFFGSYFERGYRYVLRYVHDPDDAADVTLVGFERWFAEYWKKLQPTTKVRGLLYPVLWSEICRHFKKKRVIAVPLSEDLGTPMLPSLASELETAEFDAAVEQCFAALPDELRRLIKRNLVDEVSLRDLAMEFQLKRTALSSRRRRAFALLRQCLEHRGWHDRLRSEMK